MTEPERNVERSEAEASSMPRRNFLRQLTGIVGWASLSAWLAGTSFAALRFFFPKVRYEPPTKFKIGKPADYVVDHIDSRWLKEHRIFVVRKSKGLYVLQSACTHLGCSVTWFQSESMFKCPCHGSFFDVNGDVIGGPAPSPLTRVAVTFDLAGDIVVDTIQKADRPGQREEEAFLLKV